MIESEAIKNLKDILSECTESGEAVCYITDVDAPALEMAIKALEKQIPKKPIENDTYGEYYKCPICNKYIVDNFGCGYKFCRECGQAIDWSDEEYGKNGT